MDKERRPSPFPPTYYTIQIIRTSTIRTVTLDGNPWFVTIDVCRAMGVYVYGKNVNVTMATRKLNPDETMMIGLNRIEPWPFGHQARSVSLISESGLYKLIMRSDVSDARRFQDWVTRVVLPAIRKDGGYIAGEEKVATGV